LILPGHTAIAGTRLPPSLAGLDARRSLLSVDNLVAAIATVLAAPQPLRRPLIVADPEPLTLPGMIAALRQGLGRRPGLFPVPAALLHHACRAIGQGELYDRVSGSLVAEAAALRSLGWTPTVASDAGLAALMRAAQPEKGMD
jgi:UDP-glucose 4-epimerase